VTTASAPLEPRRSIGHQAVFLAGSTGLAQILLAVIYVLAARGSDPRSLGLIITAIALGTTAAGFVDFGTNSLWAREIARRRLNPAELGARVWGKLLAASVLGCAWVLVTLVAFPLSHIWPAGIVMVALLANQTMQVSLRGAARGELVSAVILVDRAVAILLFLGLLSSGVSVMTALWLSISVGSASAAVLGYTLTKKGTRPALTVTPRRNPWSGARNFGLAGVANSAQTLDLPLLTLVGGPVASGLYGAVSRWTQPMSLLATAFASASAPFAANAGTMRGALASLRRGLWMPVAAIVLALTVFALSPWIVDLLLGQTYEGSAAVLRILALVSVASIISQPLVVALQSLRHDGFVAAALSLSVLVQLGLVTAFARHEGALGAALASLIVQALLLCALLIKVAIEYRRVPGKAPVGKDGNETAGLI
jgi:O-antigen/teichoic acid export membrane protein